MIQATERNALSDIENSTKIDLSIVLQKRTGRVASRKRVHFIAFNKLYDTARHGDVIDGGSSKRRIGYGCVRIKHVRCPFVYGFESVSGPVLCPKCPSIVPHFIA
ncbi:hypothetical protein EVAR_78706_1 [Eumeta japonica]|uniref:Uncharacterized protein n=1 Tax=Eumeta variegata TaxID=151549 RepID=A0A4C1T3Q1_EUMVA|nr:hypothetical protein EVAR_78706_1 [Eumeta japonica]